jgi:hypothetical protein
MRIIKIAARISSLLLFLFWLLIFIEHLNEWFFQSSDKSLPLSVWLSQFFIILMLIGFITIQKNIITGSIIILLSSASFFLVIFDIDILYVVIVNLVPVILFSTDKFLINGMKTRLS